METVSKRAELNGKGWVKLYPSDLLKLTARRAASIELPKLFEDLPSDPYCTSKTRLRRFVQFDLDPVSRNLRKLPAGYDSEIGDFYYEYFQNKQVNPDHGGVGRRFPALHLPLGAEAAVREIIWSCYDLIEWDPSWDKLSKGVGVHAVSYRPREGFEAVASPHVFHQDGEPYTFGILVERHDVEGGENYIGKLGAANKRLDEVEPSGILDKFTLEQQFEGFGVCDRKVTHYVSALRCGQSKTPGSRNVFLIDFTPKV